MGRTGSKTLAVSALGPLSLVLNTKVVASWDTVVFHNRRWLIVPVQPVLEILGEVKEEAVVAENERRHQRDTTSGWEKGFSFIMIKRDFIQQTCSGFSF